jgi:hypothetical protein
MRGTAFLVLLMGGIMEYTIEIPLDGMVHMPRFMMTGSGVQAILKFSPNSLRGCSERFMKYAIEMASGSMICVPSFMIIDAGVQAILRFYFNNLRADNVGIADGRDLLSAPLRWAQVA